MSDNILNRVVVIGDSWAYATVAFNATSRGWVDILNIPPHHCLGRHNSTAREWVTHHQWLREAQNTDTDYAIVSLCGNDFRKAISDGHISPEEKCQMEMDIRYVCDALRPRKLLIMQYSNPNAPQELLDQVNAIARCGMLPQDTVIKTDGISIPEGDLHPNFAGHEQLSLFVKQALAKAKEVADE